MHQQFLGKHASRNNFKQHIPRQLSFSTLNTVVTFDAIYWQKCTLINYGQTDDFIQRVLMQVLLADLVELCGEKIVYFLNICKPIIRLLDYI
jgi:hypothetical protein